MKRGKVQRIDLAKEAESIALERILSFAHQQLLEYCRSCDANGGKPCQRYEYETRKMAIKYIISVARWN